MKGTDEQLDEEVHGARSGRVPSAGTFVSVALGASSSQYQPRSSSNLVVEEFL